MKKIKILLFLTVSIISSVYFSSDVYAADTCCSYKTDNGDVVLFYLATNQNGNKQPMVCLGTACMTSNFSKNNVQLIDIRKQPEWNEHAKQILDSCSKMPENIWYDTNNSEGKVQFYPSKPKGAAIKATSTKSAHQCTSDVDISDTESIKAGACHVYKSDSNDEIYFFNSSYINESDTKYYNCLGSNCLNTKQALTDAMVTNSWKNYVKNIFDSYNMPKRIWVLTYSNGDIEFLNGDDSKKIEKDKSTADFVCSNNAKIHGGACNGVVAFTMSTATCPANILTSGSVNNGDGNNSNPDSNGNINWGELAEETCDGLIGQEMLDFINKIFRWIQIIAPIFVIIMGSVELAGAVLQDDKDALKKATSKFTKRLIIAVALFFIPVLLSFILQIFNDVTGKNADFCEIGVKENE